ncbi:MAG: copper chaperone PCu(A)C [Glaciecola sp.]
MKTHFIRSLVVSCVLSVAVLLPIKSALALHPHDNMAAHAEVQDPWARATFALAKTGAAYMTLNNVDNQTIVLSKASVSETLASMTQLHTTSMQDGMMRMQELVGGIEIAPQSGLEFTPGGKHIMIMGLTGPLNAGESIDITLTFSDDSIKTVTFPIKDAR